MDSIQLKKIVGLAFDKYPQAYKDYIHQEEKEVLKLLPDNCKLLDVGCGSDMAIEKVVKKAKEFVGVDCDEIMVYEAKDKLGKIKNVKVLKLDVHQLSKNFPKHHFDYAIAMWNAIGSMGDEQHWLDEVAKVTKGKIILSVVEKGHIEDRINYYEDMNSTYVVMEDGKETISSPLWGYSRAFSREDLEKYAKNSGLKVEKFIPLAKIGLLAILSKK
jgi:ubiquinone/menaquinone biosynthesis C-methylase UbiE